MILTIVLLLAGLALIVFGADALVEGASSVARRFGLSEFVIGLTIVGMGTSAPEMPSRAMPTSPSATWWAPISSIRF